MGRLSVSTRKHVIVLWRSGIPLSEIHHRLMEEEIDVSLHGLQRLRRKFQQFFTIRDLPKATCPRKLTETMMEATEENLRGDDELTTKAKLADSFENLPDGIIVLYIHH